MVDTHLIDDHKAKEAIALYLDLPIVELADIHHQVERHLDAMPANFTIENRIIPFDANEQGIKVAIAEPSALRSISSVRLITGKNVAAYIVSPLEMEGLIKAVLESSPKVSSNTGINITKTVHAADKNKLSATKLNNLMGKTSVLAKPPAEPLEAQDESQGKQIISFVNDMIFDVMRILDRDSISFDLDKLGFPEKEYADVISAFESSQGMVLVTGPTGFGKSTTLYGALKRLNKPGVNILTAEDPVEFTIDGVGQVQIRDDIVALHLHRLYVHFCDKILKLF